MLEKDAIKYLVELGETVDPRVELPTGIYSTQRLERINKPICDDIRVSTLTGLVDYIKNNIDNINTDVLVQVKSHKEVRVYSPLNADRVRELYIVAELKAPDNIIYERFMETERFNIMLQSGFINVGDKEVLLKYTGLVQDSAVKSIGDDGVGQQVTVKTGVATVSQAVVPNPVSLAPFRTFQEIPQPISKFIFRMKEGPTAALFEADGGAWKNEAILDIKAYLQEELEDIQAAKIIA